MLTIIHCLQGPYSLFYPSCRSTPIENPMMLPWYTCIAVRMWEMYSLIQAPSAWTLCELWPLNPAYSYRRSKVNNFQSVHAEGEPGDEARRGGFVTHLFECTWNPMEYPMYYRAGEHAGDRYSSFFVILQSVKRKVIRTCAHFPLYNLHMRTTKPQRKVGMSLYARDYKITKNAIR